MSQYQSYKLSNSKDSFIQSSVEKRSMDFYSSSFKVDDSDGAQNLNSRGHRSQNKFVNRNEELEKSNQLSNGFISAFGCAGYPGELSLFKELDVNLEQIVTKSLIVLRPFSCVNRNIMNDSDLAGPLIFCLLFGISLLLSGRLHFGFVYGLAVLGSIGLHLILKMMSSNDSIDFLRTASVLGYCLLPLVLTSTIAIFINIDNLSGYILSLVAILWCTLSASSVFVSVLQLSGMKALVIYPLTLFYGGFALLFVFSE
ncbi:Yip1-domain-containing protein [Nadsonia fulvescens var. elongata DSM 6958]|uniref:Protein YIP n=1 Tax=Nadsonia fulvescens var. elongata DSM 6958 TaxID=857566 RepID=A0A1E3PMM8_9ASCO|nr:Yip1-domain-containing protein [Nadsonia fulvescens var. elongata DSM 6958]